MSQTSRADRFQQQLHQQLEEAWERLDSLPLMKEVKQLEPAALLGQLRAPQGRLLDAIDSVTHPDLVAVICGSQGRRLERELDHSPAVVLQRMQAFAAACWLDMKHAGYRVDLGETVKLLVDLVLDDRLQVIEALAGDAAQIEPDFHGVWGLKAYVMHQRSREAGESAAARDRISQAIGFYEQALDGQPPDAFRARYLVGLSMALFEEAFFFLRGHDSRPEDFQELLERARDVASESTRILDRIDPPEWAYIAKGNAEMNLGAYGGRHAEYETAISSFTTAANMARAARRPVAVARLRRARCRLWQTRDAVASGRISADEAVIRLENDVLSDLVIVLNSVEEAGPRAELKLLKSETYLFLAELPGRNPNEDLANADLWCERAAQTAWDTSLWNWSSYQKALIDIADVQARRGAVDFAVVQQRAKKILDAAHAPDRGRFVAPADEYAALVLYLEGEIKRKNIDALSEPLEAEALSRFPAEDPERIPFRAQLLGKFSEWIFALADVSEAPDSPFERARRNAENALELANRYARDDPDEGARLLGKAHGALGVWYASKFYYLAKRPNEAFTWGKRASEELAASVRHYDAYRENCPPAEAASLLVESVEFRWRLGFVNLDLLKAYSSNLDAGQWAALLKQGRAALESLAPLLPRLPNDLRKRIESALEQLKC